MNYTDLDVFALNRAKKIVFSNWDRELTREDLFSMKEWNRALDWYVPQVLAWKHTLAKQNYKVGDVVVQAERILRGSDIAIPSIPSIELLGEIIRLDIQEDGWFGRWAIFKDLMGGGQISSLLDGAIIVSPEQSEKILQTELSCDELGLPIFNSLVN